MAIDPGLLCCPSCKCALGESACSRCGRIFERSGDQYKFVNIDANGKDAKFQLETQNKSSFVGKFFAFGKSIISSEYQPHNHLKRFLELSDGLVIEMGSGSRRLRDDIVTIDLFPGPNVDVVADIAEAPFRDNIADSIILDSVIEHVPDPKSVVAEARRILKPGGKIFINVPFMLPYHGYPRHYQNFSRDGLEEILSKFSACEIKPTFGPMTAWVNMTSETFAVLVAGERGATYVLAKGFALLPIFWLKYLDYFFVKNERAHRISGLLCAEAVK